MYAKISCSIGVLHCAECDCPFTKYLSFPQFGQEIMNLLDHHGDMLESNLRKALVHGLVLLRKRSQVWYFDRLFLYKMVLKKKMALVVFPCFVNNTN